MHPRFCRGREGLVILVIGMVTFLHGARADTYSNRLQFAAGLYTRGMYDLAVQEYSAILKEFPEGECADAVTFRLAESLRLRGDGPLAARLYSRVVAKFRESPFQLRAAYRRARLYMDDSSYAEAAAHFNVILKHDPPEDLAAAALYYLGESQEAAGDYDRADDAFARVIETYPASMFFAFAQLRRGVIRRDQWLAARESGASNAEVLANEALAFFKKAEARAGTDRVVAEALFQIAEIYFRREDYERSVRGYRALMTRYPDDKRVDAARLQAAWSASNAGLYAETVTLADQALAAGETTGLRDEWLYIKANAERQLLQHQVAVSTYQKLLTAYPKSRFAAPSRYEIAVTHFKLGDYEEAVRHAETVRMAPELETDVCWLLAESFAALGRESEATQYYRIVIRDAPETPRARDAMYRLAHQLQKQEAYREASEFYNKLVAAFPDDPLAVKALYASGLCLSRAEIYEEAVRDWRRLIAEYPDHALVQEALYQRSMNEIRLGRTRDAAAGLSELFRRFPDSRFTSDAYYWKGMLLRDEEQFAKAEEAFRKAMQTASREDLKREATFELGLVLQQLDRLEDAAALLQDLLDTPLSGKFPPELLEWMSTYHCAQGACAKAAMAAEKLVKTASDSAWKQAGWVLLGRAEAARQRTRAAETAFREALDIEVNTRYAADAALQLGDLALARDAAGAAEPYFRLASRKAGGDATVAVRARSFFGLGRAAEMRGHDEAASRYFMSVAILYDHKALVPESLYRAAAAFDRLGRTNELQKAATELSDRYAQSEWAQKMEAAWLN